MAADSAAAYRLAKEASVSNLAGSSLTRIHLLSATALSSYALHALLRPASLAAQFALLVVPLLLACTLFSSPALSLVLNAALLAGCFFAQARASAPQQASSSTPAKARRRSPESAVPLLAEPPMRISIDSAADAAHAAAAPPTMYAAPDELRGAEASPTGSSADTGLAHDGSARRPSVPDAPGMSRSVSPLPGASIARSGSPLSREVRTAPREPRRQSSLASTSSPSLSPVVEPPRSNASRGAAERAAAPPADPVPAARPFIAVYRAHMMLMTLICILAVDFERIFARELAKCESWGTSLVSRVSGGRKGGGGLSPAVRGPGGGGGTDWLV
jgi:phosphatidylinositol glycan class W